MNAAAPFLACAATARELEAFGLGDAETLEEGRLWRVRGGIAAVTGVGIPFTLLRLLPLLGRFRPSLLVNTGIAGAYPGAGLGIGDVVLGESEVFADLGMELPDGGFEPLGGFPFAAAELRAPLSLHVPAWAATIPGLRRGRGATVNACAGTDATGARRRASYGADFESMEGAAVALAGREAGIPVITVRAISNLAARRDMRPENVGQALGALRGFWSAHCVHLDGGAA